MSKLVWDQTGDRLYETGTDRGVVYPYNATNHAYDAGYAWNGLTGVNENPSGAEATEIYADNMQYLNLRSKEKFGATVEAYTYPPEFATLDGTAEVVAGVRVSQQKRGMFGMSYRTLIGNDVDGEDHGYKLHLVYGATVAPSQKGYKTVNDNPEAITFSWELSTTPIEVNDTTRGITGFKPTAHLEIDSTKVDPEDLAALEAVLYGTDATTGANAQEATVARLPLPAEVISFFQ